MTTKICSAHGMEFASPDSTTARRGGSNIPRAKRRNDGRASRSLTVATAADQWLETRIATGRNDHNRRKARARAEKYLKPFMGLMRIREVTINQLRAYRLWLEGLAGVNGKERLATRTVAWVLGDAKNFFYWAVESGLIDKAPVPRRLLPRLQERPPDHLTDAEVARILAIREPHAFVVRLGLATGMRWSELCRARASDLQDGMLVVHQTKSGKLRRIPLEHAPAVMAEIEGHVGRLCPYGEENSGSFSCVVRRHSGIHGFHFHQLRHTFAVNWLRRGGTLVVLQQILGHATVTMTQRYARLTDEHVREEARRLQRFEQSARIHAPTSSVDSRTGPALDRRYRKR